MEYHPFWFIPNYTDRSNQTYDFWPLAGIVACKLGDNESAKAMLENYLKAGHLWPWEVSRSGKLIQFFLECPQIYYSITPKIWFSPPTPANNKRQIQRNVLINLSFSDDDIDSVVFNWNGANYSIFDPTLILGLNLDESVIDFSRYNNNCSINETNWTKGVYGAGAEFD
jgi:hypothetical protein